MVTPSPSIKIRKQRKKAIEEALADGYSPVGQKGGRGSAVQEAARRLGLSDSTLHGWVRYEKRLMDAREAHYFPGVDDNIKKRVKASSVKTTETPDPEQKPTIRVRYEKDDHGDYYVVAIGDCHDSPDIPDKSRFRHAGQFVAEKKPDVVIQIGDFFTFDSISQFAQPGSIEFKELPTFPEDITSAQLALDAYNESVGNYNCCQHVTLGNHEDRIWSHMGRQPQLGQLILHEFDRLLARNHWSYSPFSQPYWLGGVAFSHVPLSIMGRPIGGELSTQNIALKAVDDHVYGHTHRADVARRPKIGGKHVTAINLGSYLPAGHLEHYIKHGTLTGWTYSLFEIRISKGRIQSYRQHTVDELSERYG